jgi:hypothetical protein
MIEAQRNALFPTALMRDVVPLKLAQVGKTIEGGAAETLLLPDCVPLHLTNADDGRESPSEPLASSEQLCRIEQ